MIRLQFSKAFIARVEKLPPKLQTRLQERLELFCSEPYHPQLRNHQLRGDYAEYRSINITGDVRALYLSRGDEAIFDLVGTHSQLYGK